VLFTAGLAALRRDAPMGLSPGMCELPVEHFRRVATAAGAAQPPLRLSNLRTGLALLLEADVRRCGRTGPTIRSKGRASRGSHRRHPVPAGCCSMSSPCSAWRRRARPTSSPNSNRSRVRCSAEAGLWPCACPAAASPCGTPRDHAARSAADSTLR
jgi:hypothetical protein